LGSIIQQFAVECKVSSSFKPSRGFWYVLDDVGAQRAWIIAPNEDSYNIKENVFFSSLSDFLTRMKDI